MAIGENQDLNITIKAKDDATAQIKNVQVSMEGMTSSVFKANAAWDILKASTEKIVGFFEDSIIASAKASGEMAIVQQNVINAGMSYDELGPKIKAYSDSMIQMGFDDESTATSVSKLLLVTGDYSDALKLNHIAMDLARNKGISLEQATTSLAQVLQGAGGKALMQYGLSFKDGASAAEVLTQLQEKLKGSTESYANTAAGKLETVAVQWTNIKESLGDQLMPIAIKFFDAFEKNLPTIEAGVKLLTDSVMILAKEGKIAFEILTLGSTHWADAFDKAQNEANDTNAKTVEQINLMIGAYNQTHEKHMQFITSTDQISQENLRLVASASNVTAATEKQSTGFNNVSTTSDKATSAYNEQVKKLKDLGDTYLKLRQVGADALADLEKSHNTSVTASQEKIDGLKKSLKDLAAEFTRTAAEASRAYADQAAADGRTVGEQIVAQQNKIADLKKQAGMETDPQKKINLLDQLKVEQDAYASQADFITSKSAEVAEAQRRDGLTEFERQIEDYKTRRDQADQEYADKRADAVREYAASKAEIKQQLAQEQEKLTQENLQYQKAQLTITLTLLQAEAIRLDTTRKSAAEVVKLVDQQIERYNRLAEAIARASQGKGPQLSVSSNVPVREHGGIVPGAVGTAVPIIAHGQERVVPALQTGSGMGSGPITISINSPTIRNDNDLELMRQAIEDALRDVSRVHKLTTI